MKIKNTNLIKETNLDTLRKTLMESKTATKPQLSELTGISVVTINSLIKTLLLTGEVKEDIIVQAQLGRPAVAYKFNPEFSLALVVYMHEKEYKDTTFFTVCNLYGEELIKIEKCFEKIHIDSFDSTISALLSKYPNIKVIGFGIPQEELNGKLIICDYPDLENTEFVSNIEKKFNLPVFIENDVNAATIGYYRQNCTRQEQTIVGLYFPSKYPPGAGICINNTLVKGKSGLAGEIKYLPFNVDYSNFEYKDIEVDDFIIKTIKSFMCLFNPDTIVLYKENIREDYLQRLKEICLSEVEKSMLPKIVLSDGMNKDFEAGIISLALEKVL